MPSIPRWLAFDSTLALLRDGYAFVSQRARRCHTDAFDTRLLLREVTCALGADAAAMFYEPDRFTRNGALTPTTLRLLQDTGSVFLLDGAAHRWRKQMFMSLMTPSRIQDLADVMREEWRGALPGWEARGRIVLNDELQRLLLRVVCRWAGIPLSERAARRRAREIRAMLTGAGSFGPRALWALLLRVQTEQWCRRAIAAARAGRIAPPAAGALHTIAWHRDQEGDLLDTKVAAVELLNIVRPTVAVAWFITFAALALHEHPAWRARLAAGEDGDLARFVQEVRRYYPFFPFVGGRARRAFAWQGTRFAPGRWVILDLYGTDHDPRIWEHPERFDPDRFREQAIGPFNLIPQGGGDSMTGHRCPGEGITLALMREAVRLLLTTIDYGVPPQDLGIDLGRFPTLPASEFVMAGIRPLPAA